MDTAIVMSLGIPKDEFLEKAYALASRNEATFGYCGQAVLAAFQEIFDMRDSRLLKAATYLAGGTADQGFTCGALMGGVLVIGMKWGRDNLEDRGTAWHQTFPFVHKLFGMFREEFGSIDCRDIIGFDPMDSEKVKEFFKSGLHDKQCGEVAGKTARMVAEVLYDIEQYKMTREVDKMLNKK